LLLIEQKTKAKDVANRVKITFPSNPTAFYLMSFSVFNVALGYSKWLSKTFITGVPAATNQVRIGATLAETMTNLLANLNANDLDGIATFEASGTNGFYVNLRVPATWSYTNLTDPGSTITTLSTETISELIPENLPVLDYKDISIRIYDTYENERILIQELASANACKIDFNGGDDLTKALAISKLVFNMAVLDAQDAKFLHLFSGDEKRYRVEVVGINEAEDEQLLWRGFLLPDQYNEPYKQVLFFVDFTATDMIGSLKGKYFPAWYYQNTLPIAKVIAYCLEQTGLGQNLVVKPSVVPESDLYTWESLGINMLDFIEGEKYKDCYEILEDIVSSNLMTLYSFRGYWWLEGIHRRAELETTNLQFNTNGDRIADLITEKELVDCGAKLQPTPNFTALTPWRQVNLNFKANSNKNMFPENIVNIDDSKAFFSNYKTPGYSGLFPVDDQYLSMVRVREWRQNLSPSYKVRDWNNGKTLFWSIDFFTVNGNNYNSTESQSLNNYIEAKEQPYIKSGVMYNIKAVFFLNSFNSYNSASDFKEKLDAGYYDKLVPFQIFIDGIEKYSNRPSFAPDTELRYEIQDTGSGNVHRLRMTLDLNFKVDVSGFLKFRILMPIFQRSLGGGDNISIAAQMSCEKLELAPVEALDENDNVVAVRPINFTTVKSYDLKITSTVDNSVLNSFKIGYESTDNYFYSIDRSLDNLSFTGRHYFNPATVLNLNFNTWESTFELWDFIFSQMNSKKLFIENVSGVRTAFESLWYGKKLSTSPPRLGYLTSYTGFPNIPKNYKAYPGIVSTDVIKYMDVKYPPENFANRLRWKLVGSTTVDTFPKTVAKALHGIQAETMFRLEASALALLWPCHLIDFYFNNEDKVFIPTTLNLDLFAGKTKFVATEAKFTELTDIQYE
jgi:hypothetical protein